MKPYKPVPTSLANAEVEDEETMLTPTGQTFEFEGKTHAEGGIPALLAPGTKIFSKKIKLPRETVKSITGQDKRMSPADLTKKFSNEKFEKILQDKTGRYDNLSQRTASLMLAKNLGKHEEIFEAQENYKAEAQERASQKNFDEAIRMVTGGKFQLGGTKKNPWEIVGLAEDEWATQSPGDYVTKEGKMYAKGANGSLFMLGENYPQFGEGLNNPAINPQGKLESKIQLQPEKYADMTKAIEERGKNGVLYNAPEVENYQKSIIGATKNPDGSYTYDKSEDTKLARKNIAEHVMGLHGEPTWKHISVIGIKPDGTKDIISKDGEVFQKDLSQYQDFELPGYVDSDNVHMQPPMFKKTEYDLGSPVWKADEIAPLPQRTPTTVPKLTFTHADKVEADKTKSEGPFDPYVLMQADNLVNLVTLKRKNPYYAYSPSELAYTRFEPLNTKSAEIGFQKAVDAIETSGLPEQVKQARIADLHAQMQEGMNQTNLANFQGDLANDNANVERYNHIRNNDIQRRTQANYQYAQDSERADFNYESQKQAYKDSIFGLWKDRYENQQNLKMISEFTPNYEWDWKTKTWKYKKNTPLDYNKLDKFGSSDLEMRVAQIKKALPDASADEILKFLAK